MVAGGRELIDTLWNVNTEEFSEDVQTETVIQYFFKEGLEECLEANDYTIIKGNPMEEI